MLRVRISAKDRLTVVTSSDTKIDIPRVLGRLAPTAEYHWKGNGWGTYADIGEWRSPLIPKPSEVAVYAEWDLCLAEQAKTASEDDASRHRIVTLAQSAVGVQVEQLSAIQVRALIALLLRKEGALTADGSIKPLTTWAK
ncbi:MAG: hypothetical protein H0X30_01415 [Anaerolineae bacterium]|nr:hypothetical protein [Anaerolineae bacterium]